MNFTTLGLLAALLAAPPSPDYFEIQVIDQQTGRGVPLIELKTVHAVRKFTDSAGRVAFHEPGLMGRDVYFHVSGHGYEYPADGFGFRGKRLTVRPGGKAVLKIKRRNLAERLYRVTGAGCYADTVLLGHQPPIDHPLLNAQVLGSDSVITATYRGKLYWFWGDTNRPSYPLGNFHVPGAVSPLPAEGGLDPSLGVNLQYFTDDDGFARPTARMPGEGPTWLGGLTVLPDGDDGEGSEDGERMFAMYVKIKPPLTVYERGIAEFDDQARQFRKLQQWDLESPLYPHGHPLRHSDNGRDYVYFADPYPLVRVPADPQSWRDPRQYETYTYLKQGASRESLAVERDASGKPRMQWKADTVPLTWELERQLIERKLIAPEEAWIHLRDIDSGQTVVMHRGSVYWNAYRRKWIMIGVELFGTSALGEVWYAEADDPVGPWRHGKKIVTHDNYSFYNPKQHPRFDQQGGRLIYFEGTYTHTFSGNSQRTPRYDYNQIMYRLDLDHPGLAPLQAARPAGPVRE